MHVLVLDEPRSGLDAVVERHILDLILGPERQNQAMSFKLSEARPCAAEPLGA